MATPRLRHDAYGRPLPYLAETAPRREPVDTNLNAQQQAFIETLLAQAYDALLVPGVHAEVHLIFTIHDGKISREIYTTRREQHRLPAQE